MTESGSGSASGLCPEDVNCVPNGDGMTLLIVIIVSAVVVIILALIVICCVIGVSRYLRRRKKEFYDLKNDHDGYLFNKPTSKCIKIDMQSCHSSTPEITSETFSPNTVTSEFSYGSSGANSNLPITPPSVTKPVLEPLIKVTSSVSTDSPVPIHTNESQQSPVQHPAQRQLSIPKRKRPRDDYDKLIKASTTNGTMMVFQNEATPVTKEDTVIENIHSNERGTLEEGAKSTEDDSQQASVPVATAVRRHESQRAFTNTVTHQDLSHSPSLPLHIIASTTPAIDTASVLSRSPDPEYVEISNNVPIQKQDSLPHIYSHIDDPPVKPRKPHTATGKTAKIGFGREYSYAAQHSLHSEKHKPGDNGVFIESTRHQHGFGSHRENTCTLQEPASQEEVDSYLLILPDTDTRSQSSPDVPLSVSPIQPIDEEPYDDTTAAACDHTYSNLPQDYEVPIDKKTNASNLNRHLRPASGLKRNKTLPATLSPAVQASSTKESFYTSLLHREVQEHDYDNPSPTHSQKSPGSSPRKPRLARRPKQIVSGNTSCMDYTNISVWLSSEKKPHQSATKSSTLPPGYTPLLHNTTTTNADYDYALPDQPRVVSVRKHALV